MSFLNSMFGAVYSSWSALLKDLDASYSTWLKPLMSTLSTVLWVLLALVGAAGGIYALYVGIKMARADSADQREENKKRLINIVVSIVVVIVLIIFFNTFLPMILGAFNVFQDVTKDPETQNPGGTVGNALATIANTARCFLHI